MFFNETRAKGFGFKKICPECSLVNILKSGDIIIHSTLLYTHLNVNLSSQQLSRAL